MFFRKNTEQMIDALDEIEEFIQNQINSIPCKGDQCEKEQKLLSRIVQIGQLIESKQREDLTIYGEIMLSTQKLADGYTSDRVTKKTSNDKLNYIAKSINAMSEKLEDNLTNIDTILKEYAEHNFKRKIDIDMFRGGSLKELSKGINYLKEEITKNLMVTYRTSLVIQKESAILLENSTSLSQASMKQAASLEETAAAIEEITNTITNNSKTASSMVEYGNNVQKSITHGMELTNNTVKAMNEINDSTNAVHESLAMIDQIAFQTNILSLNAAVEAATAGEAGRGFAVVAQEVRNLATRSAEAAKKIKDIVENAALKANEGKSIADKMIEGYEELNENITQTTKLINNVVEASQEQKKESLKLMILLQLLIQQPNKMLL